MADTLDKSLFNLKNPQEDSINMNKPDMNQLMMILDQLKKLPEKERNDVLRKIRNMNSVNPDKQKFSTMTEYNKKEAEAKIRAKRQQLQNNRTSRSVLNQRVKKAEEQQKLKEEKAKETQKEGQEQVHVHSDKCNHEH
jgi:hypothetical protein